MRHFRAIFWMVYLLLRCCGFSYSCGNVEYDIDGECCPMCTPGTSVFKHCTEFTSTSCKPCPQNTFTDQPNGLPQCLPCTECDAGLGLKTHRQCTSTSDAECGPLDQHHCTERNMNGCRRAQKHTICKPGHFIKHQGTPSTDTQCGGCPDKTFSNTFSATQCHPHTQCQSLELQEITAGTDTSDTECGSRNVNIPLTLIFVLVPIIGVTILIAICILRTKNWKKTTSPAEGGKTSRIQLLKNKGSPGGPGPDPVSDLEGGMLPGESDELQRKCSTNSDTPPHRQSGLFSSSSDSKRNQTCAEDIERIEKLPAER